MTTAKILRSLPQIRDHFARNEVPYHFVSTSNFNMLGMHDWVRGWRNLSLIDSFDGSNFRQLLMSRYDIQVNKTSRDTVLFIVNIGATQATVDYLFQVLMELAARLRMERRQEQAPATPQEPAWLPPRRTFHPLFLPFADGEHPPCDVRSAHYLGLAEEAVEYLPLSAPELQCEDTALMRVSAAFVTPYPPGFPVLVPGQCITPGIVAFFDRLRVREIHGYSLEKGFRVFRRDALAQEFHP